MDPDGTSEMGEKRTFFQSKTAVLCVVALALFTDMAVYGILIPILPTLVKERLPSLTASQIGFLFASYSIGILLITPIIGIYSDKYQNRKVPMILGMFGLAYSTFSFAYGQTLFELVAARICQGVAGGASWTIGLSMLADSYPSDRLGNIMSKVVSATTLGFFVGPPLGGLLFQHISSQAPFFFCAGLALIDLLLRLALQPQPVKVATRSLKYNALPQGEEALETDTLLDPSNSNCTTTPCSSRLSISSTRTQSHETPTRSPGLFDLVQNGQCICTCVCVVIVASIFSGIEPTLPVYLADKFNYDPSSIGLVFIAILLPNMASSFIIGPLSDRVGRKNVTAVGLLLCALSTPLIHLSPNLLTLILALGFFGMAVGVALTPTLPEMADIVEQKGGCGYASVYALYNVAYSGGMMLGPLVGGALTEAYGFPVQMHVFALMSLLYSPVMWVAYTLGQKS